MKRKGFIVFLAAVLLTGCGGKGPQIPNHLSGEKQEEDSTRLAMMMLNGHLAEEADKEIRRIAQASDESYALYDRGTWVYFYDQGDDARRTVRRNEECEMHMRVYSLSGKLYCDSEVIAKVGQREVPPCIDWNVIEWNHGAKVKMLVPWYSAYGMKGTDDIPPYENVIIELEIR